MPSLTIHGLTFHAEPPYTEGHSLSSAEAQVLNSAWLDRVRNNFAKRVKAAKSAKANPVDLQAEFASYASAYRFGGASPGLVFREAKAIARVMLSQRLNAQGLKIEDLDEDVREGQIASLAKAPDVQEEALRRIEALQRVGESLMAEQILEAL